MLILIAEDNPADAALLKEALKKLGLPHETEIIEDGQKIGPRLCNSAKTALPDLILMDLNMPGKNGREILAEIKTHPELSAIPVLVFTSSRSPEEIRECYRLHANAVLSKPMGFSDLLALVRAIQSFWFEQARLSKPS